jgi:hypothetical protein
MHTSTHLHALHRVTGEAQTRGGQSKARCDTKPNVRHRTLLFSGIKSAVVQVVRRGEPEEEVPDWGGKLAKLSALKPDSVLILLDS